MRRPKDITGQRFGHLTALYNTGEKKSNFYVWHCVCDCGKEKDVPIGCLTSGNTTSCGCAKTGIHTKDNTGQTFGQLTALYPTEERSGSAGVWHCRCACGGEKDVPIKYLILGRTTSCGYAKLKSHPKNIAGQTFGDLTAIEPTERRDHRSVIWKCRCVCGNEVEVSLHRLRAGTVKDCGCRRQLRRPEADPFLSER